MTVGTEDSSLQSRVSGLAQCRAKRGREETDPLRIINYRTDPFNGGPEERTGGKGGDNPARWANHRLILRFVPNKITKVRPAKKTEAAFAMCPARNAKKADTDVEMAIKAMSTMKKARRDLF